MNSGYLSKDGDCLTFADLKVFNETVATLDLSVPPRTDGRKSFHRERVSVIFYLKGLVQVPLIEFPFTICKSECPDFVLTRRDNRKIGIEHRDITSEKWQQYLTEFAKKPSGNPVFLDQFKLGGPPTIEANQGWVGGQEVSEWATLAFQALEAKLELLNRPHYQQLSAYELLLYSNTHLPNVEQQPATSKLSIMFTHKYRLQNFARLFDSLSVIYGDHLWLHTLKFRNAS